MYDRAYHTVVETNNARQTQVLHVTQNHWIVVSNSGEQNSNIVDVYDSLWPTKITDVLVRNIAAVFRFSPQNSTDVQADVCKF